MDAVDKIKKGAKEDNGAVNGLARVIFSRARMESFRLPAPRKCALISELLNNESGSRCCYNALFAARIFSRKALAISINWDFLAVQNSSRAPSMASIASSR
jgi:hypothetical protein